MPSRRLRKRLLDRILSSARDAGERGLAFLITAGVASVGATASTSGCGSDTTTSADGGSQIEAPCCPEAAHVEAANGDSGHGDGASDAGAGDTGSDSGRGDGSCEASMVEAANFDSGC
jgi:hypothetical protein